MSYPGHSLGWVKPPLQRSSRCILRPEPTGQTVSLANSVHIYVISDWAFSSFFGFGFWKSFSPLINKLQSYLFVYFSVNMSDHIHPFIYRTVHPFLHSAIYYFNLKIYLSHDTDFHGEILDGKAWHLYHRKASVLRAWPYFKRCYWSPAPRKWTSF